MQRCIVASCTEVWLVIRPDFAGWGDKLGLLLLSTIAYLPLVAVVVLNLLLPAQRVFQTHARDGVFDEDASRNARRRTLFGAGLLAGLTLAQCGALAYSIHNMNVAGIDHPTNLALVQ
ncbi:hypothetical protein [Salinisphaera hydrothermalis]|uniref:hypothetical protein n=1 Tax=Salinisphaera hydrothermalis TaxID=563188 RepID=UPI0012EC009B|nr:hypothetical protein [Salinisphaera hydrothermalis]